MDNPFNIPLSGSADWDTDLSAAFQAVERGYHVTERAGQAISSGQVLTLNSGGFFFPYAPGSASIIPHAYAYTAASSGDSLTALAWGIVRSLDINSLGVPGKLAFSTASGFLSTATLGVPLGSFLKGEGVLFNPSKSNPAAAGATALAALTDVDTTGLSDGKVLTWSDSASKWAPAAGGATTNVASIVQKCHTRVGSGTQSTLTASFAAPVTVGNTLVFMLMGYGSTATPAGYVSADSLFTWGKMFTAVAGIANQQAAVLAARVDVASQAYSFTIQTPNGGITMVALEIAGGIKGVLLDGFPAKFDNTHLYGYVAADSNNLTYIGWESDANAGLVTGQSTGLVLEFDGTTVNGSASNNHPGYFFRVGSAFGRMASTTITSPPTTPIAAVFQIQV